MATWSIRPSVRLRARHSDSRHRDGLVSPLRLDFRNMGASIANSEGRPRGDGCGVAFAAIPESRGNPRKDGRLKRSGSDVHARTWRPARSRRRRRLSYHTMRLLPKRTNWTDLPLKRWTEAVKIDDAPGSPSTISSLQDARKVEGH